MYACVLFMKQGDLVAGACVSMQAYTRKMRVHICAYPWMSSHVWGECVCARAPVCVIVHYRVCVGVRVRAAVRVHVNVQGCMRARVCAYVCIQVCKRVCVC